MPQPTLFSFFSRTPKSTASSPSTPSGDKAKGSSTPSTSGGVRNGHHQGENGVQKSPKISGGSSGAAPSTPVSRGGGGIKRRRTSGTGSQSAEQSSLRKKLRNDESPTAKEFTEGALVWAKLEGYPWWPAMVRGETHGGPYSKNNSVEFHVQFFDNPPSRAWIRKGDLKLYKGSQDADIPPAKSDRGWISACKTADAALEVDKGERVESHWYEFKEVSKSDEEDNKQQESDTEKMDVSEKETPKSRQRESKRKHKRVLAISSSSENDEEEDETPKKIESSKKSKNIPKHGTSKSTKEEEDNDYSPTKNESESESPSEDEAVSEAESEVASEELDEESPPRNKKRQLSKSSIPHSSKKPTDIKTPTIKDRLQRFASADTPPASPRPQIVTGKSEEAKWTHMKLPWAQEGKRKDAKGNKEGHENFDPRTLYVPPDFLRSLTPAMRQWWETKSKHFDTVLFFKVGKFYEFYHWDACIAVEELGITYMRGEHAHSGFPEISFTRFANALVQKGYKIARIEQTETPDMLAERIKKTKPEKHEKVIKREICQVSTKGVRYMSFQDEANSNPFTSASAYLLAVTEKAASSGNEGTVFGVCFIDTTIGTFHLGQFDDDRYASRLRTMLSHYVPAQILYEKGRISANLQQLFHNMHSVRKDPLLPESELWNAKKTLKFLAEQNYFPRSESNVPQWPPAFQTILSKSDALGLTADDNWELGVKCLGGIIWYLKHCLLDHDLLSQRRFEIYQPVDVTVGSTELPSIPQRCVGPKYMVLDGITLRNLDILDGPSSLLATIDKCGTNFGKRLLRHWVCLPLAVPQEIAERQEAIEELMKIRECREKAIPLLKSLPDLERILSKIHYLGSAHRSKNHPDGRAFFFEEVKYSKNKISDLLSTLRGFKTCVKIIQEFKNAEDGLESKLLKELTQKFPLLDKLLSTFDNAFDHQTAAKEGKIKPKPGADEDYDNAVRAVSDIEDEAQNHLKTVARQLNTRAVYFGSDKKRFQIEVPDKIKVPKNFELTSSRKGFKRYHDAEAKGFVASILKAEAEREEILRDITRRIFARFDKHRDTWSRAVECIANLDVLISLALFSESQEVMCRPTISYSDQPFLHIVDGRHPCVASDTYIPNDTKMDLRNIEFGNGNFIILTGPNMGGKSTLMRQVGLVSVLSHLGCYVPAESCELSVVDRIFTRLGANDNIGEGESTFFVEMSETSSILKHGTANSLLLIDELGRGTATYDGTAIAYAVARELSDRRCRAVFSTHYHTLVESLQNSTIQMSHMACMVENENEDDPTQESITFLYKMISGPCPKSYGFNAARLAGISNDVIRVAHKKAKEFEKLTAEIRNFTDICSTIHRKKFSLRDFEALKI